MASTDNERAGRACKACKLRKKACDKVLPTCGECARRKVDCSYDDGPSSTPPGQLAIGTITELLACTSQPQLDGFLNLQVCRIEYLSGISVVKALERYVRYFHHWLCVVDGNLFEASLVKWSKGVPPADFSVLAMTLYLFSFHDIETRELYMLTRLQQTRLLTLSAGHASPSLVQSTSCSQLSNIPAVTFSSIPLHQQRSQTRLSPTILCSTTTRCLLFRIPSRSRKKHIPEHRGFRTSHPP